MPSRMSARVNFVSEDLGADGLVYCHIDMMKKRPQCAKHERMIHCGARLASK